MGVDSRCHCMLVLSAGAETAVVLDTLVRAGECFQ